MKCKIIRELIVKDIDINTSKFLEKALNFKDEENKKFEVKIEFLIKNEELKMLAKKCP